MPQDVVPQDMLLIEIDGPTVGLARRQGQIAVICKRHNAREVIEAAAPQQSETLWKCCRTAIGVVGRLSPDFLVQDGVVPRQSLPQIVRAIGEIGRKHGLRILLAAHAGEGHVLPIVLFDRRDRDSVEQAKPPAAKFSPNASPWAAAFRANTASARRKSTLCRCFTKRMTSKPCGAVRSAFDPRRLVQSRQNSPLSLWERGRGVRACDDEKTDKGSKENRPASKWVTVLSALESSALSPGWHVRLQLLHILSSFDRSRKNHSRGGCRQYRELPRLCALWNRCGSRRHGNVRFCIDNTGIRKKKHK